MGLEIQTHLISKQASAEKVPTRHASSICRDGHVSVSAYVNGTARRKRFCRDRLVHGLSNTSSRDFDWTDDVDGHGLVVCRTLPYVLTEYACEWIWTYSILAAHMTQPSRGRVIGLGVPLLSSARGFSTLDCFQRRDTADDGGQRLDSRRIFRSVMSPGLQPPSGWRGY